MLSLSRSVHVANFAGLVIFLYLLVPSFGLGEKSSGQAPQNLAAKERIIKRVAWRHEPVKISKLKVKGKQVELTKKFVEEDDWLNGLTVTVENTSDKTIVWIDLALNFPRPAGSGAEPDARDHLVYGHYPPLPGAPATLHAQQPPVKPNESVELVLNDYKGVTEFLRKTNYHAGVKQLDVEVSEVVFDDGTKWSGDALFRRDPNNPERWVRADEPQGAANPRHRARPNPSPASPDAGLPLYRPNAQVSFLKTSFIEPPAPVQIGTDGQCYGGCGRRWHMHDEFCRNSSGATTRCAVRFDWVSCNSADPRETSVKIVNDRCVNRDTHVACSLFKWTDVVTPCPPVLAECTPQNGSNCPPGTYPDGSGMCCAGGSCGGGISGTDPPPGGDVPSTNLPPPPGPGGCGCDDSERLACYTGGGEWSENTCTCISPIVVDVRGDGFALTNAASGVWFDITADGVPEHISWTAVGADDAWLALDRNGNGTVDSGAELFGNFTPQPSPPAGEERNGFLALAVYDRAGNGGNDDGIIDKRDAIFPGLRLWQDTNHDGVSQAGEMHTLRALGLKSMELDYKKSKRVDEHGNRFRYRAKVRDARDAQLGRWAWDVFLVRAR